MLRKKMIARNRLLVSSQGTRRLLNNTWSTIPSCLKRRPFQAR